MKDKFKKKNGYWVINSNDTEYYMRSHPLDMYDSMKMKGYDKFIVYKSTKQSPVTNTCVLPDTLEEILDIKDLEGYINIQINMIRKNENQHNKRILST